MDPILLSLLITKILLINAKNLFKEIGEAKSDDGKVTVNELPEIIFDTMIKSLDDLGVGDLAKLVK